MFNWLAINKRLHFDKYKHLIWLYITIKFYNYRQSLSRKRQTKSFLFNLGPMIFAFLYFYDFLPFLLLPSPFLNLVILLLTIQSTISSASEHIYFVLFVFSFITCSNNFTLYFPLSLFFYFYLIPTSVSLNLSHSHTYTRYLN